VPGFLALVLWKSYGGHLHIPETLNLLLGHFLRAMLSVGIAVAAAAVAESAASAAMMFANAGIAFIVVPGTSSS